MKIGRKSSVILSFILCVILTTGYVIFKGEINSQNYRDCLNSTDKTDFQCDNCYKQYYLR